MRQGLILVVALLLVQLITACVANHPSGSKSRQTLTALLRPPQREFGKINLLSNIIADKNNRTVVKVVQNLANDVFLPIAGIP
ncbi:MAG: hypothetical protein WAO76_08595 [Georgfuchsia sp.]